MDTVVNDFKNDTKKKGTKLDACRAFFYNILVPDLLLFSAGISIVFAILLGVF